LLQKKCIYCKPFIHGGRPVSDTGTQFALLLRLSAKKVFENKQPVDRVKGGTLNISRFLQFAPNVFLFKHSPFWLSNRYLRLLGKLYYIVNKKERIQIEKNIMDVFKGRKETREIIKKTFDGIFIHYSEKLIMAYKDVNMLKKEIGNVMEYSGLDYLEKAVNNGGVLLVTGHFGAVEFLPLALHLRNYPVSMTVSFQSGQLKKSLLKRAEEGNVEIIECNGDNVMYRVLDAMKRGRILLTECDEVDAWKAHKNKTIHAFGGEIKYDRCVEVLRQRTGATVLCSFMVRTKKGYRLNIIPVGDGSFKETDLATKILKTLEKFVMKFPDQWYQWKKFHKMRSEVT